MNFTKMHGAGNDFVIIEGSTEIDYSNMAASLCKRHFSVGADGFMVVEPGEIDGVKMSYYNADGSIGEMCGNGARCLAMFAYEKGLVDDRSFNLYTLSGKVHAEIINDSDVRIAMGRPEYDSKLEKHFFNRRIEIEDKVFRGSYILMGVPHLTIEVDVLDKDILLKYGPLLEKSEIFSKGTNVNFVHIISDCEIDIDTWERGAGNTLACGTGSLAAAFSLYKLKKMKNKVKINAPGGTLRVIIEEDETVFLEGNAIIAFEGTI
ncbi:MAG: diaminopimelate epimerase [Bacillota bacterium]|nr:diaminopimelate epimerase [Bacillota bacterium]